MVTKVWRQISIDDYLQQLELEKLTDEELVKAIEEHFGVTTHLVDGAHEFKMEKLVFRFYFDRLIGNGDWEDEIDNPTGPIVIMWDVWGRTYGGGGPADSIEIVIKNFSHYLKKEE